MVASASNALADLTFVSGTGQTSPQIFQTRARYGNDGTSGAIEYGVANTGLAGIGAPYGQNIAWPNGQAVSFALSYDSTSGVTTLRFDSAGTSTYTAPAGGFGTLNLFLIGNDTQTINLTGMHIDGTAVGDVLFSASAANQLANYYLTDPIFGSSFNLTGNAAFGWTANTSQERPKFEFTAAGAPVSAVPEPSSWALLATALVGLGFGLRRRLRS